MIGALRQRLVIERPVTIVDGGGGKAISWQSLDNKPVIWAKITPLSAGKKTTASQNEHGATHKILLRFRDDLRPDMRFRKGARIFIIMALLPLDENQRFLEAVTREITP